LRPNPLSLHPLRHLGALIALAAALAVLALVLGVPPRAQARAHSASCRHSSTTRHGRRHRVCVKASHKSKAHARHPVKTHRHAARVRTKVKVSAHAIGTTTTFSKDVAATCEDGSHPLRAGDEVFECEDGSEPRCEAGSTLALSGDGLTLLCSAVLPSTPGSGEVVCEDSPSSPCAGEPAGSTCAEAGAPSAGSASSPSCEDPGESACEASSGEAGSGEDPTLVCNAPDGEAGESGEDAGQGPAGPRSHAANAS
jgi:hypothetical protein